jgi:hypothetical protein
MGLNKERFRELAFRVFRSWKWMVILTNFRVFVVLNNYYSYELPRQATKTLKKLVELSEAPILLKFSKDGLSSSDDLKSISLDISQQFSWV